LVGIKTGLEFGYGFGFRSGSENANNFGSSRILTNNPAEGRKIGNGT
jgi:hypothetical protein